MFVVGLVIASSALVFSLAGKSHAPEKPGSGQTPQQGNGKQCSRANKGRS
jgi:hypothetical protein